MQSESLRESEKSIGNILQNGNSLLSEKWHFFPMAASLGMSGTLRRGAFSERIASLVGNALLGKTASLGMDANLEIIASLGSRVLAMAAILALGASSKTANLGKDVR